jgi:MFS transporter, DHA1 family, inner membrane transport protein
MTKGHTPESHAGKTSVQLPLTIIFLAWIAGLCAAAQFAKVSLIFPELQQLYPGHGTSAGFLVTLISFVGAVLGLVTGMIVGRFGVRKPLLWGLVLGAIISALQALLPPFHLVLLSRVAEGVSHLLIVVAAPSLIARVSAERHKALAMTLWGSFFGVAFALMGFFGIPFVKAYGVPALFVAHGTAMIVIAVLLSVILPGETGAPDQTPLSFGTVLARHVTAYRSPWISAAPLGWLFYTLSFVSLLTVLPGLMPEGDRVFASTALPIAGIVMSLTLGAALLQKVGAVSIVMLGFALSSVFTVFLGLTELSVWIAVALFAVLGLVQGATFAAVPALNADPRDQALAYGGLAQMGNLGNLVGTVILLALVDRFGNTGLVTFGFTSFLAGLFVHASMKVRRQNA